MNSNIRSLKRRLLAMKQARADIYIKYADGSCYKLNEKLTDLIKVDRIPAGANVTEIPASYDEMKYIFTGVVDNEPEFTYILSVSEAKEQGIL